MLPFFIVEIKSFSVFGKKICFVFTPSLTRVQWFRRRGCMGCKNTPKSFELLKTGHNPWKFGQNPWKSKQNLKISRQNLWKSGHKMAPNGVWLWKMTPKVCRKTNEDKFIFVKRKKTVGKRCTTTFWTSLGKFGQKSFAPQKFACSCTYLNATFAAASLVPSCCNNRLDAHFWLEYDVGLPYLRRRNYGQSQ